MTRRRDEFEERNVERALGELGDSIAPPDDEELRALARAASATERPSQPRASGVSRLSFRLRWTIAAAAVALLVGSGLGFGVGNSVTPTVQAGTTFTGTGFLPAQGWNVRQSATAISSGRAAAIAANVPLHLDDSLGETPSATLASLPDHGVLIHATFTTRGDPTRDALFPERALPLQVAWAKLASPGEYRLRAGTGGYNVDARIHYGSTTPSPGMLGEAQLQLSRLVVAPERVTLSARPMSLRSNQLTTLFGAVSSGKADEEVTIQAKDCGQRTFTGVAAIQTHEGGTFDTQFTRFINSTIRAVWNGEASPPIELRQQPRVVLDRRSGRRFAAAVASSWTFWRKKLQIQRRVGSQWTTVRTVTLTDSIAPGGSRSSTTWAEVEFRLAVPRGTQLRAMLTADQAKPCYLASVSDTVRA